MEDNRIITLFWERDEEALLATKKKYENYLYSVAHNILQSKEDADECENDTYLSAWNAIPPARPRILSAFLAKITRNLSLTKLRNQTAEKRGGKCTTLCFDELAESIPDAAAFDKMTPNELANILNAFLKTLADTERRVFVLRYWYGDPIEAIATRFGYGKSRVKMMLLRTRKKLRDYLKKEGISV